MDYLPINLAKNLSLFRNVTKNTPIIAPLYFIILKQPSRYIEERDYSTIYLCIYHFYRSERPKIHGVLGANNVKLKTHQNLIFDIRKDGCGQYASFKGLIPYLFTNLIKRTGLEKLSVKNAISQLKWWSEEYPQEKEDFQSDIAKLKGTKEPFIRLSQKPYYITKLDQILKIFVLIDSFLVRTAEQILTEAKQNKKTKELYKIYAAAIGIYYLKIITSPTNLFRLTYCQSRNLNHPNMRLDDNGILPKKPLWMLQYPNIL